jgi:3-hydroxyisobutyrate dehydrogenase-like beta-hydroxyacid dehydrogenase
MNDKSKRIGLIGLGAMGAPMARQILQKHGQVTVFDVDPAAVQALIAAGATAAGSPKAVGHSSDIVITMLPHPDVFRDVLFGNDGLADGLKAPAILIDMSTNGTAVIQEAEQKLRPGGIRVMDAPVGKGPWAAEKGDLTILMGGDEATCREAEWVLGMVGSKLYHCGPLGAGQVVKLANNLVSCGNMAVLAEAYALAKAGGAKMDVLTEVMPMTSADSWQLRNTLNGKILKGDFSPMFKLKLANKDMRLILDMAKALGTPIEIGKGVLDWYERGEQAGHGELDWGAILLTSNPELKSK